MDGATHVHSGREDISQGTADQLLARLGTSVAGLDSTTARARLTEYGPNDAAAEKHQSLALQFLARFRNPLIIILLAASALSAVTGDVSSFLIITAIVLLSIVLDFVQEVRAQNAVEALRRSVAVQATVRRDGRPVSLPIDCGFRRFQPSIPTETSHLFRSKPAGHSDDPSRVAARFVSGWIWPIWPQCRQAWPCRVVAFSGSRR